MRANLILSLFTFGGSIVLAIVAAKIQEHQLIFWALAAGFFFVGVAIWAWPLAARVFRLAGRDLRTSSNSPQLVGAIDAFNAIISKSRWAKRLRERPDEMKLRGWYENSHTKEDNIKVRLGLHLGRELHDKLRAGELTALGRINHDSPLRPISKEEWDEIEIMFDPGTLNNSKSTCAWLRNRRIIPAGGRIRYIQVQFPKTEIRKLFR